MLLFGFEDVVYVIWSCAAYRLRITILQASKIPSEIEDEALPGVESSLLSVPSKCAEQAEEFVKKVKWCYEY